MSDESELGPLTPGLVSVVDEVLHDARKCLRLGHDGSGPAGRLSRRSRPDACRRRSTTRSSRRTSSTGPRLADRAALAQTEQHGAHLLDRLCHSKQRIPHELGLVTMALGLLQQEGQLGHHVLEVVGDEAEALADRLEALRLGERRAACSSAR